MEIPSPSDLLQLLVEASLALAGFASIVVVISEGGLSKLSDVQRLNLVNLLATSFGALFSALICLGLLAASVDPAQVWQIISAFGLVMTLYFGVRGFRQIVRSTGYSSSTVLASLLINLPLLLVCGLLIWNVLGSSLFWPVFAWLGFLFLLGVFSFVRLIVFSRED